MVQKWLSGRMAIKEISKASGYSSRQLRRWFEEYLDEYPTWTIRTGLPVYLLIAGTYYADNRCLIAYRAENTRARCSTGFPGQRMMMKSPPVR